MKDSYFKKTVLLFSLIFLGPFIFAGCYKKYSYPVKPFTYNKIPADAVISMTFNAEGYFFIADSNGKPVRTEKVSFAKLMELADKQSPGWIEILGSYTLVQIEGDRKLWVCDNEFECVEGRQEDKNTKAVFSINYDYQRNEMFFADKDGNRLELEGKKAKGFKPTSKFSVVQGDDILEQRRKPFTALVREIDFGKKIGMKTLNRFVVYKIKGSQMVAWYSELTNCWTATCMDSSLQTCGFDSNGECPPDSCPR